jgi:hypothetical protein
VIAFLAGPKAAYVSGATIVVDGGGMAVDGSSTAFHGPHDRLRELLQALRRDAASGPCGCLAQGRTRL